MLEAELMRNARLMEVTRRLTADIADSGMLVRGRFLVLLLQHY